MEYRIIEEFDPHKNKSTYFVQRKYTFFWILVDLWSDSERDNVTKSFNTYSDALHWINADKMRFRKVYKIT